MDTSKSLWLPPKASTFADIIDATFYGYMWMSAFFLVLIAGLIIYFVYRYIRKKPDQEAEGQFTHNLTLEITWSIIPLIIVIVLFYIGVKGYLHLSVPPANAMEIRVTAQKWSWLFGYANGAQSDTLVVPINQPVKLLMSSRDVLHSLSIPAFRVKNDVLPNRYTSVWFEATRLGAYRLYCTEYCGTQHSKMKTMVKVVSMEDFNTWLEEANMQDLDPVALGEKVYSMKGCNACHSLDGTRLVGPTWKGIWGTSRNFTDGTSAIVDENYLRISIENPADKIVDTYAPVMPPYKGMLSDNEIAGLVAYIKSLK